MSDELTQEQSIEQTEKDPAEGAEDAPTGDLQQDEAQETTED